MLLRGAFDISWNGRSNRIGPRADVFAGYPHAVYVPAGWHLALLPGGLSRGAGGRTAAEAVALARRRDPHFPAEKVRLARDGYFSAGIETMDLP